MKPPIKGGQGRSSHDIESDAIATFFTLLVGLLLLVAALCR